MINPRPAARDRYTISALAERFGVSLRTLRFYEQRGLLDPEHIEGQRYYSEKDIVRLQVVLLAKSLGFTIVEIKALIDNRIPENFLAKDAVELGLTKGEIEKRLADLTTRRQTIDDAIDELGSMLRKG